MAQFDLGGVLGAVLGGGRGRRRRGGGQDLGRALGMLVGAAVEAMAKTQQAPPPAPRSRGTKPLPGGWDEPAPAQAPPTRKPAPIRASVPAAGGPWGGKPAATNPGWDPVPAAPTAPPIAAEDREGVLMLRAMIAAAKSDGQVDTEERARIADQLDAAGLSQAAREAVLAEFGADATAQALAREASDPMLAAQLYAAAVAGAGTIEGAERTWLDTFARALRLDRAATEAIEQRIKGV